MKKTFFVALFVCCVAAPSYAQNAVPLWDFSAGYSLLRDQEIDESFNGWLVGAGFNMGPVFSVVGELGGNYKSFDEGVVDIGLSTYSIMFGPRIQSRDRAGFTPYGQILLGGAWAKVDVEGDTESENAFALQPGAGLDFWIRPNMGIRLGVDYRRIFFEDAGSNQFRIQAGIVLTGGAQ